MKRFTTEVEIPEINGIARGLIRIPKEEFPTLKVGDLLTHFNLSPHFHKVGEKYVIAKLLKHGFYKKTGEEKQPLMDYDVCYLTNCVAVREELSYDDLTQDDFTHSLPHIKSLEDLKKYMVKRYSSTLPDVSTEELEHAKVSITVLQVKEVLSLTQSE